MENLLPRHRFHRHNVKVKDILSEQELISFEDEKPLLHLCRSAARRRADKQEVRSVDEAPLTGGGGANVDGAYQRGNQYIFYLLALYIGLQILPGAVMVIFLFVFVFSLCGLSDLCGLDLD